MKIFAFLLSFYILALNCFPCGDSEECNEIYEQSISIPTANTDHEHPSEACSPFCSCACCAATGFYQPVHVVKFNPSIHQQPKFYYLKDHFNSNNLHAVWQPPRLSWYKVFYL